MTLTLRTALGSDKDRIIELIQTLNVFEADLTGDRKRDRAAAVAYYADLQKRLAAEEGRLVVAEAEGAVVGYMAFCIELDAAYVAEDVRRHGTVAELVVEEGSRGRGIGGALLVEAERLAREAGLKRLIIGVLAANEGAERLYRRSGFTPYVTVLVKGLG